MPPGAQKIVTDNVRSMWQIVLDILILLKLEVFQFSHVKPQTEVNVFLYTGCFVV